MQIDALWRHPVKSMIGESIEEATLGVGGMLGDRTWAVRDEVRGGIRGAKKIAALMQLAARAASGGQVDITLPDGTTVSSSDDDASRRVSIALDHRVTLCPLHPVSDLDHYRRGSADHDDILDELRDIFGRTPDEPLPDLSRFPAELVEFESPPGTYFDAYPLLLLTTSALRSMRAAVPGAAVDVRRFRPNVVIDTGAEPGHPESAWVGRTLLVGDAVVRVIDTCPRCVMVTHRIDDDAPADRSILRHVVRDLDQAVGVYATIVTPATVRVGDVVQLVD